MFVLLVQLLIGILLPSIGYHPIGDLFWSALFEVMVFNNRAMVLAVDQSKCVPKRFTES